MAASTGSGAASQWHGEPQEWAVHVVEVVPVAGAGSANSLRPRKSRPVSPNQTFAGDLSARMPEPGRTEGGRRRYGDVEFDPHAIIRHARQPGFSLEAIRELLDLSDSPERSCAQVDAPRNSSAKSTPASPGFRHSGSSCTE